MLFCLTRITVGALVGLALSAGLFTVWMVFGANPDQDPLLSW